MGLFGNIKNFVSKGLDIAPVPGTDVAGGVLGNIFGGSDQPHPATRTNSLPSAILTFSKVKSLGQARILAKGFIDRRLNGLSYTQASLWLDQAMGFKPKGPFRGIQPWEKIYNLQKTIVEQARQEQKDRTQPINPRVVSQSGLKVQSLLLPGALLIVAALIFKN